MIEHFIASAQSFLAANGQLLLEGSIATLIMTFGATVASYIFGGFLGILLTLTHPQGIRPQPIVNGILGWLINIGRSLPFIILIVALMPLTSIVMGTRLGVAGALFPLIVGATPFVARIVEQSLLEVDAHLIEAAQSMGASTCEIIFKVLIREALPSLLRGLPIVVITILSYSAIAGTVGAGGLGDIAIRYGYERYQADVMLVSILILLVMVQLIQSGGDLLVRIFDKRMRS